MKKFFRNICIASALISGFTSCEDDVDPVVENQEEVITDVTITLTAEGFDTVTLTASDTDGDQEIDEITGGSLVANTLYTGSIELLNSTEDPAEDITEEIKEEMEDHQFFYNSDDTLNLDLGSYLDEDADGNPVGLEFTLQTGNAGSGDLTVILLHEPNKEGENVAEGDPTNAEGEEDVNVVFPISVNYLEIL